MPRSKEPGFAAAYFDDFFRVHSRLRASVDGDRRRVGGRQIMGTTVIGGMLAASVIGNLLRAAIFYLVEKWSGAGKEHVSGALPAAPAPAPGD